MAAEDWTEKYRPMSLGEVLGNPGATKTMREWAESWKKGIPRYRALVLIGTPGIGKTSAALALAKDMGWSTIEMNASDQRTASAIENVAGRAAHFNTFDENGSFENTKNGKMKLIILDEADSLYGNSDRGGMPAILQIVRSTMQPVILICNDFYGLTRKSSAIKTETVQITFKRPQTATIAKALMKICAKERAHVEPEAIQTIAENANGDIRAAIRDLQSLSIGKELVTSDMADTLSERESRSDMYQFVNALLQKRNIPIARQILRECDVDPPTVEIWIDENLPTHCASKQELSDSFNALSRADIHLGRVNRRMYYGLWSYANDMMVDGVASTLKKPLTGFTRINFPRYLSLMSRSRTSRAIRHEVADKLSVITHASANRVLNESMEFFSYMCKTYQEFAVMLVAELDMRPEEIAYLLDCKSDDKRVKAIMNIVYPPEPKEKKTSGRAKKTAIPETQVATPIIEKKEPAKEELKATEPAVPESAPRRQKSLFDF